MHKVYELSASAGMVKVFKDSDSCGFVVKAYAQSQGLKCVADYETPDRADAYATAAHMLTELEDQAQALAKAAELAVYEAMTTAELRETIAALRQIHLNHAAEELQAIVDARLAAEAFVIENAELAQALQAELGMGKPLSREERVAELDRWIEANRLANGMHDWHVVEWCHHIATQCQVRFGAYL